MKSGVLKFLNAKTARGARATTRKGEWDLNAMTAKTAKEEVKFRGLSP